MKEAVPGLDFLLAHPDFLDTQQLYNQLYIPNGYIPKLIKFRTEYPLDPRYSDLLSAFGSPKNQSSFIFRSATSDEDTIPNYDPKWHEYQALAVAKNLSPHPVILTYDPGLKALARMHELKVETPLAEYYSGRRKVTVPIDAPAQFFGSKPISLANWKHAYPNQDPLQPNEFVELDWPDQHSPKRFQNIRRYDSASRTLEPLEHLQHRPPIIHQVFPRNNGQAMLFDALLAPAEEIPLVLVSGAYGTGKTFLTVAAAYAGVHAQQYDHIYVCARDSRLGDEIGAVPGDTDDKVQTKVRPIEDSLRSLFRLTTEVEPSKSTKSDKKARSSPNCTPPREGSETFSILEQRVQSELMRNFTFIPMIELGGRSLSHSFIICDEFQDTNSLQAHATITRLADYSKIVLLGDFKQVNNPELSSQNNGLRYAIQRLGGKAEAIYVDFEANEIVRHPIAQALACYLD